MEIGEWVVELGFVCLCLRSYVVTVVNWVIKMASIVRSKIGGLNEAWSFLSSLGFLLLGGSCQRIELAMTRQ